MSKIDLGPKKSFNIHKGALHRATGTPEGSKIPASKMRSASNSQDPHVRRMAASAKGLKAMAHGGVPGNDSRHDATGPSGTGGPLARRVAAKGRGQGAEARIEDHFGSDPVK
jgi:hypothetical protein